MMVFTEEQVQSGYADYCNAVQFIEQMDESLVLDDMKPENLPSPIKEQYDKAKKTVEAWESTHNE